MKNGAIRERREKVWYYLVKGIPEIEIAGILKVHRNTVVRDVRYLKGTTQKWLDGLARGGFIEEYRLSLDALKDSNFELQKLYLQSSRIAEKVQIRRALDENKIRYMELLSETPTIHAYRRRIRQLGEVKQEDVRSS